MAVAVGRGKPRLGGLTIEETSDRQDSASKASGKRRNSLSHEITNPVLSADKFFELLYYENV